MKILLIHSDFIEFEAKKKAIKDAEDWNEGAKKFFESLVVFTAVEKRDELNLDKTCENAVKEIEKVFKDVKAENIVIYPYAHLSSELSSPMAAMDALKIIEKSLKEKNIETSHAPFGFYKSFSIKAKGHPLSELSRVITAEERRGGKQPVVNNEPKELTEFDHRLLGKKLDLFSFNEFAPGMPFFHPKGVVIRNVLMDFSKDIQKKYGYKEIITPLIMNESLWRTSGHWDHYKENMFFTRIDDSGYAVKPMNCPGAIMVFKSETRSYRDLPLRLSEYGTVHRNELSGVLSGLFRVRAFTQDDAHIFTTEKDLEKEISGVVDIIKEVYDKLGFEYSVELSTRPDDSMGSDEIWEKAESSLKKSLDGKIEYKINEKDGAFYGPKIDFHIKDSLGRTWQCATCQIDFMMPERFDISYTGEDNKPHKPVIIHRVIYGSIERFIGIITEHFKGAFPVWISPIQTRVIAFSEKHKEASKKVYQKLLDSGIRCDIDLKDNTVDYKIRDAELQKIPYIIVIGDKEEESDTLALRERGKDVKYGIKIDELISRIKSS